MIRQKFGQSDLAAMAGIARENVNRILADWRRRKLISRISGYYCIEKKSALQREMQLSSRQSAVPVAKADNQLH